MSTTTPADRTIQNILNTGNLNDLSLVLQKIKLGNVLGTVKVVCASLTATAAPVITGSAVRLASTITGLERGTTENLPPILAVKTLRVTGSGTAGTLGTYGVTDTAGTGITAAANTVMGVAKLSDDGTTLTFTTTITDFVLEYIPRPNTDLATVWPEL